MTRWTLPQDGTAPVPGRKEDAMTEIDLTPEAVERFDLQQPDNHMGSAYMQAEPGVGDWVRYADYAALSAKLAEVEAERDSLSTMYATVSEELSAAEAALATARADALREVLALPYREERLGGQRHNYIRVEEIAALIPQEKPHE